jgi:hypothetical protein
MNDMATFKSRKLVMLAALCTTLFTLPRLNAQTNLPAPPTQVVLLGTQHGAHKTSANYSLEVLRRVLVTIKPAAILIEQPPEMGGQPTVLNGRATNPGGSVECTMANLAADELDIEVISYDREGRNELYQKTRYFARQQVAWEKLEKWLKEQKRTAPDSIPVLAERFAADAISNQARFDGCGPELINSPAYDAVIIAKHHMLFNLRPRLLKTIGEKELAEEFRFVGEEWQERNEIMARNIRQIATRFPGKRLVVMTGAEHRYILQELLGNEPALNLLEFYETPEWTGAKPPAFAKSVPQETASPGSGQQSGVPATADKADPAYTLVGIGVELQSGYPDIKRVFQGSPAEASGRLHTGDRIIAVAQGDKAFMDARSLSMAELVQAVRGKAGTKVRLQVLPAQGGTNSTPKIVTITRARFKAE